MMEDTFLMLKPDCLKRGLFNEALQYLQAYNEKHADAPLRVRAMTRRIMDAELMEEHYRHVPDAYWNELRSYYEDEEVVAAVVHGEEAVDAVRDLVVQPVDPTGKTFLPENSSPGTMRGDLVTEGSPLYADPAEWPNYYNELRQKDVPLYNFVHAAEDHAAARAEIERFFGDGFYEEFAVPQ